MAGRKTPPKQDLLSTLLGKFGLAQPKKEVKKKRRKGPPRPRPADEYGAEASPFSDYVQESGLGFQQEPTYEAAAAAGFAPPPPPTVEPLFPDAEPALPSFGGHPATATMAPPPAFASAVAPPPAGKLFSEEALDNSLDALFAGLEMGEVPAAPAAPPIPSPELPLSTPATPKRPHADNIVAFPGAGSGPIEEPAVAVAPPPPAPPAPKTPSFTVEAPAAAAPPPAYTGGNGPVATPPLLVLSQGQDLRTLLATIDRTPGVTGSLLVGYDGLIIAFTLPPTVDRDYLAAQACNMFTGSSQHMQQLERGELRRMVLETATGAMLMTAADMGILVVVSDGQVMDVRGVSAAIAGALGQG